MRSLTHHIHAICRKSHSNLQLSATPSLSRCAQKSGRGISRSHLFHSFISNTSATCLRKHTHNFNSVLHESDDTADHLCTAPSRWRFAISRTVHAIAFTENFKTTFFAKHHLAHIFYIFWAQAPQTTLPMGSNVKPQTVLRLVSRTPVLVAQVIVVNAAERVQPRCSSRRLSRSQDLDLINRSMS